LAIGAICACEARGVLFERARRAVERARRGEGVTLLEVKTFRMKGHAEHDNAAYVPPELLSEWQAKDPLPRFARVLLEAGVATAGTFDEIQQRVKKEVDAATDEAEKSPMPRGEEAALGLFAGDGYWERDSGLGIRDSGTASTNPESRGSNPEKNA